MGAHVGDIGTLIRYTTTIDLTTATILKLKYKQPKSGIGEWPGTLHGTYSVQYRTIAITDLPLAGPWQLQVYVEKPGWKGHGTIEVFPVLPNVTV